MQVKPMQVIDQEELGMALAYLAGALPSRPRWIVLATSEGEVVGQYLGKNDVERIHGLVAATTSLCQWLSYDVSCGSGRVTVNVGDDGAWLMLPIDEMYSVYVAVNKVRSLDAFVAATREGLLPLLDILRVNG